MIDKKLMIEQGERLAAARKAAGYKSARAAAIANHWPESTVRTHEAGTRTIGLDDAQRYARRYKALGASVSAQDILFGPAGPRRVPMSEIEAPPPSDEEADGFSTAQPYEPRIPGARPEIDAFAGAGEGAVGDIIGLPGKIASAHRVVAEWLFPPGFIRNELRAPPDGAVILEVKGDSMVPTLHPGDRVIVDSRQTKFGPDAVYIIDDGDGEPRVKRLLKLHSSRPAQVVIVSDNPAHERQTISLAEVRILGRVIGRVCRM